MTTASYCTRVRFSTLCVALLAAGTLGCSSSKTADQTTSDVGADAGGTDAVTADDTAGTDAAQDTQDIKIAPDVADVQDDAGPEITPQCTKNTDCNDSDPCTDNICSKGVCSNPYNAGPCDDGDPCTQNDYCKQGTCAGKGSCADTQDDTGPDTTSGDTSSGDTSPTTGCGDTEWQSTLNDAFVGKLGTCGQSCIQNLNAQCLSDCIATSGSLSTPCADCFGELGVCVGNKCLTDCIAGATSQGCKDCAAKNCGAALSTCVGHPAPNCADATDCDDKNTCTLDTCVNMFCEHTATTCDDGDNCTTDSCDPVKGCVAVPLPPGSTCSDAWPPTGDLANGKQCALPTCKANSTIGFVATGNWTVTTKTISTTCNAVIQLVEPRANVGYTKTGKPHPMNFVGGCDYAPGGTTTQVGTIVGNIEATCDIATDASYGVTSVDTSIITFASGKGTGSGKAILYDIPSYAGQAGNSCEIVVEVTVQHVPDCSFDADCDDKIACTTDVCNSGLCEHNLAAQTCLVDGICYADGDYQGKTGNASCRLCVGKAPSQYGWVILSSGEPCDDGTPGSGATCTTGGQCLSKP